MESKNRGRFTKKVPQPQEQTSTETVSLEQTESCGAQDDVNNTIEETQSAEAQSSEVISITSDDVNTSQQTASVQVKEPIVSVQQAVSPILVDVTMIAKQSSEDKFREIVKVLMTNSLFPLSIYEAKDMAARIINNGREGLLKAEWFMSRKERKKLYEELSQKYSLV